MTAEDLIAEKVFQRIKPFMERQEKMLKEALDKDEDKLLKPHEAAKELKCSLATIFTMFTRYDKGQPNGLRRIKKGGLTYASYNECREILSKRK